MSGSQIVSGRSSDHGESLCRAQAPGRRLASAVVQNVVYNYFRYTIRIMPARPTKTDALLRLARRGPLRARDLDAASIPRTYLRRLCDQGVLHQVDRGVYRLADAPVSELSSLAEVALRVPHATICLLSALQLHGLTTELPHAVWVMIDRHARAPKLSSPAIEVVHASGPAREHGIEKRIIDGVNVSVTSPAKTVADCFRYRQHVGLEVALDALRDYLRTHRGRIDDLVKAARADRVYTFMRPYLEALA